MQKSMDVVHIALYFFLLVIFINVSIVTSFECYVCNSVTSDNCGIGSDVGEEYLVDCAVANKTLGGGVKGANWTVCRKIITWVDFDVYDNTGGIERVFRRCGYDTEKGSNTCLYRGGLGGRQQVCSCETERCNSAPALRPAPATAAMPIFLTTLTCFLAILCSKFNCFNLLEFPIH